MRDGCEEAETLINGTLVDRLIELIFSRLSRILNSVVAFFCIIFQDLSQQTHFSLPRLRSKCQMRRDGNIITSVKIPSDLNCSNN